jgi:hypothetical protein
MKKMLVAGVMALALTATSHQQASAWCKFNFSAGINMSYESTGSCFGWGFNCVPNPPPCGYAGGCQYPNAYTPYAYGPTNGYAPAYGYAPAAPAQVAPAATVANPARTQQVGYYFYGQGYTPSYWYGN